WVGRSRRAWADVGGSGGRRRAGMDGNCYVPL
ncbi:hypothetical protein PSA5_15110, partial [Pseudomonas syringae pv. actinidiae]